MIYGPHGEDTAARASIEQLENGYLVTLIDFEDPPKNAGSMEGPGGQTFTMVMPTGGGGKIPRQRKFMARDLEDVGMQLARFFATGKDTQRSEQSREQD